MTHDDRLRMIRKCEARYDNILQAKADMLADKIVDNVIYFSELIEIYNAVCNKPLFDPLPDMSSFDILNNVIRLNKDDVSYFINEKGEFGQFNNTVCADKMYFDKDHLVLHLRNLGNTEMDNLSQKIDSVIEFGHRLYAHIDDISHVIDDEYNSFAEVVTPETVNLSDLYSIDKAVKYEKSMPVDTGLDDDYSEGNLPDKLLMKVFITNIPELAQHKLKTYYEVRFFDKNQSHEFMFMINRKDCTVIDDSLVKIILVTDNHYTLYKGSASQSVTGWELYKVCQHYGIISVDKKRS